MRSKDEVLICPGCFGKATVSEVEFDGVTVLCVDKGVTQKFTTERAEELLPWDEETAKAMKEEAEAEEGADFGRIGEQMAAMFEKIAPAINRSAPRSVRHVETKKEGGVMVVLSDGSIWTTNVGASEPTWTLVIGPVPELAHLRTVVALPLGIGLPDVEKMMGLGGEKRS